jgi:hypothetical protein
MFGIVKTYLPSLLGGCEKFGSLLFHVIPAEAGIQSRTERDFSGLQILWTPVYTGETNRRQFPHTFYREKGG